MLGLNHNYEKFEKALQILEFFWKAAILDQKKESNWQEHCQRTNQNYMHCFTVLSTSFHIIDNRLGDEGITAISKVLETDDKFLEFHIPGKKSGSLIV